MSMNEDEIRIEVGFEGSQIMSAVVPSKDADELEAALAARKDG
jgi:hypothetical protein